MNTSTNTHINKTIGTIYVNRLTHSSLKNLPLKSQIFLILKFATLISREEINYLINILRKYAPVQVKQLDKQLDKHLDENSGAEQNNQNLNESFNEDSLNCAVLNNYAFEISGIFYNTTISTEIIKKEYTYLWNNLIDACVNRHHHYFNAGPYLSVPFDVVVMICEKFNAPIQPKHILKMIKLENYNEDTAIYVLKHGNIKVNSNTENLREFMKAFEIMYENAIEKKYASLAHVIRTLPLYISYLSDQKIIEMVTKFPYVLNFNFNKNPINFNILKGKNDVISVRLKYLSYDENLYEYQSTNKILSIILFNKVVIAIEDGQNRVFFNYVKKINEELGNPSQAYIDDINYSQKLLDLHLELMTRPFIYEGL